MPLAGAHEAKRTNEIGMAIALLSQCEIAGKDITADALLTQRALANYIVAQQAHYPFSVKGNQPTHARDIALAFAGARRTRLRRGRTTGSRAHPNAAHRVHRRAQRLPRLPLMSLRCSSSSVKPW